MVWIEIVRNREKEHKGAGHHLAGGVDWNTKVNKMYFTNPVTTLRVVWIEIKLQSYFDAYGYVTTLRVVWIEISPIGRCWYC